jgi:hypothetical protein
MTKQPYGPLTNFSALLSFISQLHGKSDPGNEAEVLPLAKHLVDMMKNGREFELAGLSDVPKPFLKSKGRFLRLNPSTNQYNDVPDAEAERALATMIFHQFTTDNLGDLDEAPTRISVCGFLVKKKRRWRTPSSCPKPSMPFCYHAETTWRKRCTKTKAAIA